MLLHTRNCINDFDHLCRRKFDSAPYPNTQKCELSSIPFTLMILPLSGENFKLKQPALKRTVEEIPF